MALKNPGYIDESQSLEDLLMELETQKNKLEECGKFDEEITLTKQKLKVIMQRKNQKTMEFFCNTQSIFMKYFDSLTKISQSNYAYFNF